MPKENKDFIENAICKNCKHSLYKGNKLYCKLNPKESLVDTTTGKQRYTYYETKENSSCANFEDNKEETKNKLYDAYMNIQDILKKYCDLQEDQYHLITTWIIGTYLHDQFESYPYLFLNAMKGSGKTRTMKLITKLSKDGEILLSPTEAVLFRTTGTLGIDEFENITKKGFETLRELLNACYKKGSKVKRMKQKKTQEGTQQVVEEFDVYRPLVIANISGMEEVLGDRCIELVIERSNNKKITQLIEIYEYEKTFKETKKILDECSLCSFLHPQKLYTLWNEYIYTNYNTTTSYTNYTNYTELFKKLNLMELNGRDLELTLPLLMIAWEISPEIFDKNYTAVQNYTKSKKEDQFSESFDISLIDFVSQYTDSGFVNIKKLNDEFRNFLQIDDKNEEINSRWMGRALKRLKLRLDYRRVAGGIQIRLDINKALEKLRMFK